MHGQIPCRTIREHPCWVKLCESLTGCKCLGFLAVNLSREERKHLGLALQLEVATVQNIEETPHGLRLMVMKDIFDQPQKLDVRIRIAGTVADVEIDHSGITR